VLRGRHRHTIIRERDSEPERKRETGSLACEEHQASARAVIALLFIAAAALIHPSIHPPLEQEHERSARHYEQGSMTTW